MAAFAKPLLPAGRFISRNLNKNKMKATGFNLIVRVADDKWAIALSSSEYTSPEEAAGELLAEIKSQEKQKA